MGERLILILGGARSGKSDYAQQLAQERRGRVLYVATAEAGDDEMKQRIAVHQSQRPADWVTLEAPLQVGQRIRAISAPVETVLLDCLTLLASNVLLGLPEGFSEEQAQMALDAEVDDLLAVYAESPAVWIIVSNEVGLGLVPPYPLGRVYRDVLGRVNQRLAQAADEVIFMVAGLPMRLKG
ncbi:MAG: bifunctional adenosylcobinamide kinase/adenosylcobinamide-phosphate guanylyltransferase [Anaerolineales bacterium]|jgi:adenosylcobinamide kinase/adenosylcobinamide-phosphate guanylyltransferase